MGTSISKQASSGSLSFDEYVRLERFVFKSDDGRAFCVAEITCVSGEVERAAGSLAHLRPGEIARVEGTWTTDKTYGEQIRVHRATSGDVDPEDSVLTYIALNAHVGQAYAEKLVASLPSDPIQAIDKNPGRAFLKVGLTKQNAKEAEADWRDRKALRELRLLLDPYQLTDLVEIIRQALGKGTVRQVLKDPYLLSERFEVPLEVVDEIQMELFDEAMPQRRAEAAAFFALRQAAKNGDTGLPVSRLVQNAQKNEASANKETVSNLIRRGIVTEYDDLIQPRLLGTQEKQVADLLISLSKAKGRCKVDLSGINDFLTEDQRLAIKTVFEKRLTVITGGPGTGKSTLVRELVSIARRSNLNVALCAPTGKAAQRLEQVTGQSARTINSLANLRPRIDGGGDPLDMTIDGDPRLRVVEASEEADILVCDEASMLTLELAIALFRSLSVRGHLVLIGDPNQLPPVEVGNVLEAWVVNDMSSTVTLTEIKRQANDSQIPRVARQILEGLRPASGDHSSDFHLIERKTRDDIRNEVIELVRRLANYMKVDCIWDIQVLASTNEEIDRLNSDLQKELNPDGNSIIKTKFRIGDKVIQKTNDSEKGLYNGMLLSIVGQDEEKNLILRPAKYNGESKDIKVVFSHHRNLDLAYAMTVHKAQGSEFPGVIIALTKSRILNRNHLYTALTRTTKHCVVVAQEKALDMAISRCPQNQRLSTLPDRLAQEQNREVKNSVQQGRWFKRLCLALKINAPKS